MMRTFFTIILFVLSVAVGYGQEIMRDTLSPITVTAGKVHKNTVFKVTDYDLKVTLSPLGEPDAIKYIQTLPGVASGIEGSSAIYVRGGNMGNNLISLDGIPIYGSSHLLGMASVFPSSMVDKTEFFVGGFTSEDANFSASHIKLHSKEGSFTDTTISFSVSNFLVSGDVSMPLGKNKMSLIASARYSPLGLEYKMIKPYISKSADFPDNVSTGVYDVFARLTYLVKSNHKLSLTAFHSNDMYDYTLVGKSYDYMQWGNIIVNGIWDYRINDGMFLKTNLAFNNFSSSQQQQKKTHSESINSTMMAVNSRMREFQFSSMASIDKENKDYQFGLSVKSTMFNPGSYTQTGIIEFESGNKFSNDMVMDNKSNSILSALNAQAEYTQKDKWLARVALRVNWFNNEKYNSIDPEVRLFGMYTFVPGWGVEVTADYLTQYYHTLEGIPAGWSLDMIVPSDKKNKPEKSLQLYAGTFANAGKMRFSIGGFYKIMDNLVYFTDASNFFNSSLTEWQDHIHIGKGTSYGVEFLAEKSGKRLTGRMAYTLSKTDRVYPDINYGKPIPFKFDRTHILNANLTFIMQKRERLEHGIIGTFILTSGHFETLRSSVYEAILPGFEHFSPDLFGMLDGTGDYYSHPNNYRMPTYMRADFGYYMNIKSVKTSHSLNVGVYNLTNRHNAYSLFWDADSVTWKKLSVWPIMPNFHYRISF